MTLLDVIKYPITAEFKQKDLERIPAPILINWWENAPELAFYRRYYQLTYAVIRDHDTHISKRAGYISGTLAVLKNESRIEMLKSLKKYIQEYEPI